MVIMPAALESPERLVNCRWSDGERGDPEWDA
jgi:hypothetical protein